MFFKIMIVCKVKSVYFKVIFVFFIKVSGLPAWTPIMCLTFNSPYIKIKKILHQLRFVSKDISMCSLYLLAFDG